MQPVSIHKCLTVYVFVVLSLVFGEGCDGLRVGSSMGSRRGLIDGEPNPEYMKAAAVLARDRRAAASEEKAMIKKEEDDQSRQRQHEKELKLAKAFETHQKEVDPYFVSSAEVQKIEDKEIKEGEINQEEEIERDQKLEKQKTDNAKKQKEEALEDRADEKFRQWYLRSNKGHVTNSELQ